MQIVLSTVDLRISNTSKIVLERLGTIYGMFIFTAKENRTY